MNRRDTATLVIFCAFVVSPVIAGTPAPSVQTVTLSQYGLDLQRIEAGVEAIQQPSQVAALQKSIPAQYRVSTNDGVLTVDNANLKRSVGGLFVEKNREPLRRRLLVELHSMEAGATDFANPENRAEARGRLTKILSAHEFDEVRGPTLIEVWRDKIFGAISRWWDKLMSKIPSQSGGHEELAWILITIAACVLAIWLKRMYERREPDLPREIIPFAPSGKHWRTWLTEAQEKAAQGNWRDAIHLSYWAGISHLEASGAWAPDSARTPREYLRLIQANNPSRGELAVLTRNFERIWYGSQSAGDREFSETLQHLERLGCR